MHTCIARKPVLRQENCKPYRFGVGITLNSLKFDHLKIMKVPS